MYLRVPKSLRTETHKHGKKQVKNTRIVRKQQYTFQYSEKHNCKCDTSDLIQYPYFFF